MPIEKTTTENKVNPDNKISGDSVNWQQDLISELKVSEGVIDYLYCDTVGYVTIGVGCMLPNAVAVCKLPLRYRENTKLASDNDKKDAFFNVKNAFAENMGARYYKKFTNIYLDNEAVEEALLHKIDSFVGQLSQEFSGFDGYPNQAKMAILDMAYNLGTNGVVRKFPTFTAAVRAQDWQTCAQECRRKQLPKERNNWVKHLFLGCCAK